MKIAQLHFKQGNSNIIKKEYAEAILLFDKEIELNPRFAWAYLSRGMIKNYFLNRENVSLDFSKIPVTDQSETADYSKSDVPLHSEYQHSIVAITDFDKAIELNPDFAKAYFIRGVERSCLYNHSQSSSKISIFYDVNSMNGNQDNSKSHNLENLSKENWGGIADFDKAIEIDPEFAEAYYTRGLAKSYQYNQCSTKNDLTKLDKIESSSTGELAIQGYLTNILIQDYRGAIADFDKAIGINPEYADAYYCRGLAKNNLEDSGINSDKKVNYPDVIVRNAEKSVKRVSETNFQFKDYEGVIADYDTAIKINPRHFNAYYRRGLVKMVFQDRWETIKYLMQNNPIVSGNLDFAGNENGESDKFFNNYASVITDFDKALEINPLFANAYYHRGLARFYCKDTSGAMIDWNKAIKINPNYKDIYRRIDSLNCNLNVKIKEFLN